MTRTSVKSPALLRVRVPRICGDGAAVNQSYKTQEQKTKRTLSLLIVKLKEFFERREAIWT
ncbi:MAG: hypothetical protein IPP80_13275 [Ignavibacteria bacterium]|nr:hypothetical protein [Ignavibacteria bacterium]